MTLHAESGVAQLFRTSSVTKTKTLDAHKRRLNAATAAAAVKNHRMVHLADSQAESIDGILTPIDRHTN
ncbi:MAG TPA: hypothetical protein DEV93_13075 [Chloroflexi bacterium]|nr:hypothetical protein [Chloroflexota bacterium]